MEQNSIKTNKNYIVLEKTNDTDWFFRESQHQKTELERLNSAEDLMDEGEFDEALTILQSILQKAPECIEAYNDIYLCYFYKEQDNLAFKHLKQSVSMVLSQLPEDFLTQPNQKLFWGFLENRPFLRLYVNFANELLLRSDFKEAKKIYEKVLQLNSNDNQGVRERVLICYFELGLLDDVLKLCDVYRDDIMAGILYAKPLVLFIHKKLDIAKKALLKAYKILPNVGNELIKSRHSMPETMDPGYITVGGEDEAYQYWVDFGKYWKRAFGAVSFVKNTLKTQ